MYVAIAVDHGRDPAEVCWVVGPFATKEEGEETIAKAQAPPTWAFACWPVVDPKGFRDTQAAPGVDTAETAAQGVVATITPRALVDRVRERADRTAGAIESDSTALAIEALRLEVRASTLEVIDRFDDAIGALERVGLPQ